MFDIALALTAHRLLWVCSISATADQYERPAKQNSLVVELAGAAENQPDCKNGNRDLAKTVSTRVLQQHTGLQQAHAGCENEHGSQDCMTFGICLIHCTHEHQGGKAKGKMYAVRKPAAWGEHHGGKSMSHGSAM